MQRVQQNLDNFFKDYKFMSTSLELIQKKTSPQKFHNFNLKSDNFFKNLLKKKFNQKKTFNSETKNSTTNNNNIFNPSDMIININNNKNIPLLFDNCNIYKINHQESIFVAFCILINKNLYFSKDNVKAQFMEKLKNTLAIQFDQYKTNYKYTKFNKPEFLNQLLTNKPVSNIFFYKYLSDYFNINFINYNIIDKNTVFYNDFIVNRASLIIFSDEENIYIQRNNISVSIVSSQELLIKLNIKKPPQKYLFKLSLPELQKLATDKNISIIKKGKNNTKNKTKNELIEEISQI